MKDSLKLAVSVSVTVLFVAAVLLSINYAFKGEEPTKPDIIIYEGPNEPYPNISTMDVECLAMNIWHESRGTTKIDRLSVAHVTKNRVLSDKFPNTVCGVVFQGIHKINPKTKQLYPMRDKCQFSWYCDGKPDRIRLSDENGVPIVKNIGIWEQCRGMAFDVLAGYIEDPTNGATHYLNPKLIKFVPKWATQYTKVYTTGSHDYYKRYYPHEV